VALIAIFTMELALKISVANSFSKVLDMVIFFPPESWVLTRAFGLS
jgi:hypothetical protein